mgnify:CR=1 FL=1
MSIVLRMPAIIIEKIPFVQKLLYCIPFKHLTNPINRGVSRDEGN